LEVVLGAFIANVHRHRRLLTGARISFFLFDYLILAFTGVLGTPVLWAQIVILFGPFIAVMAFVGGLRKPRSIWVTAINGVLFALYAAIILNIALPWPDAMGLQDERLAFGHLPHATYNEMGGFGGRTYYVDYIQFSETGAPLTVKGEVESGLRSNGWVLRESSDPRVVVCAIKKKFVAVLWRGNERRGPSGHAECCGPAETSSEIDTDNYLLEFSDRRFKNCSDVR